MRRSRSGLRVLALAATIAALLGASTGGARPGPGGRGAAGRPEGAVHRAGQRFARFVGTASPHTRLEFSVVLRTREAALRRYVDGVGDPTSPLYRHFLDARIFGRRFGPAPADIRRAERELEAAGLRVVRVFPQRTAIDLAGPANAVSGLFRVRMGEFVDRTGRHFNAPLSEPIIPTDLR